MCSKIKPRKRTSVSNRRSPRVWPQSCADSPRSLPGRQWRRELSFLAVHGTLHLLGYDHMTEEEAKEMFGLQDDILKEMGINR